jgi:predicted MFS family arabinose efflux permease
MSTQGKVLDLLSAGALEGLLSNLIPDFTRETGHSVNLKVGTIGVVQARLKASEHADLVIMSPATIAAMEREGAALAGSAANICQAEAGIGVRAGAPLPDIATPDAFRRTLIAARGLPSVILMRGLIAGALFGAEIYVPYLLIADYDFSPTWAGLGLTAAALLWAAAAWVQGTFGDRIGNTRITLIGTALLFTALAAAATTAWVHLPPAALVAGWGLAGAGMGLMYPRLTVLTLAYSTPQNQGFNSSALSISDAIGASVAIAAMGLTFVALTGTGVGFPVVFLLAAGLSVLALIPGLRLGRAHEVSRRD